jgi:hypothetical protein
MAKVKAKKVFTPGSGPDKRSPAAGRPRKIRVIKKRFKRLLYAQDKMDEAIRAVKDKTMTLGQASKHFEIPKTTIFDRLNSKKTKLQLGRPPELSEDEEKIIVQRLKVMGLWGFPITGCDLRYLIKSYLDGAGRNIARNASIKVQYRYRTVPSLLLSVVI